jgi:hypothetical protein
MRRTLLSITAEGPSSDIMNRLENPTGHTYLAPHEPLKFVPFDPEITAQALESAGWCGRFASFQTDKRQKAEDKAEQLRAQLETARKALNEARDVIAEIAYNGAYCGSNEAVFAQDYLERLAQIGAGRKGGK